MKRLIIMLCMALPLAVSCASAKPAAVADLAARKYVLQSVNGVAFSARERTPEIEFDENLRVAGQVCNRFMGQGTLRDGVLTVPEMASTMMLCADAQLNDMEGNLFEMLRQGADLSLRGNSLILRGGESAYEFARK